MTDPILPAAGGSYRLDPATGQLNCAEPPTVDHPQGNAARSAAETVSPSSAPDGAEDVLTEPVTESVKTRATRKGGE